MQLWNLRGKYSTKEMFFNKGLYDVIHMNGNVST